MATPGEKQRVTKVDAILTPQEPSFRKARQWVEYIVNDDPGLSLEGVSEEDKARLRFHFIGWKHVPENAEAMVRTIGELNPDILIQECGGDSDEFRAQQEIINNLMVLGVPVYVRSEQAGQTLQVTNYSPDAPGMILDNLGKLDKPPIVRMMDISEDDAIRLGINPAMVYEDTARQIGGLNWYLDAPLEQIENSFRWILNDDGRSSRLREEVMVGDISRIAANALTKLGGEINIAVIFGGTHTPIARRFQKQGYNGKLSFLNPITKQLQTPHVFGYYERAVRQATLKGEVSDAYLRNYVIATLLKPFIAGDFIRANPNLSLNEAFDRALPAQDGLLARKGEELWEQWKGVYPKKFLSRKVKRDETAAADFKNRLFDITDGVADQAS